MRRPTRFGVHDCLFQVGDDYIEQLADLKRATDRDKKAGRLKSIKRKAADSLASRDPWRD